MHWVTEKILLVYIIFLTWLLNESQPSKIMQRLSSVLKVTRFSVTFDKKIKCDLCLRCFTRFLYKQHFISNARLKLAKIQQKLSNTLRLNFCYLKIICFLHPRYHPKVIGDILKNVQKPSISI